VALAYWARWSLGREEEMGWLATWAGRRRRLGQMGRLGQNNSGVLKRVLIFLIFWLLYEQIQIDLNGF
jgi:hypothetical protein